MSPLKITKAHKQITRIVINQINTGRSDKKSLRKALARAFPNLFLIKLNAIKAIKVIK